MISKMSAFRPSLLTCDLVQKETCEMSCEFNESSKVDSIVYSSSLLICVASDCCTEWRCLKRLGRTSSNTLQAISNKKAHLITLIHLDLSVKQFDVGGERHLAEYSMAILYHGVAYFKSAPPDKPLAYEIVAEAFQGDLREQFVTALLESNSPFLAQLQYIVVTINDWVVANDDLSHRVSTSQDSSSSSTSWLLVLAVAGAAIGVLVAIAILIYIWHLNRSENFLELPEKYGAKDEFHDELDLEMKSTKSPSPEKSIISQESSKFTYNPRGFSENSTLPSQFSGLEVDSSQPINVEAWQKSAVSPITPAPFGADISAIEDDVQKDLSIVEEGPSSQERSSSASSSGSAFNYLTKSSTHESCQP